MGTKFQHLVDEFTKQVKAAEIGPSTVVALLFDWADASENVVYVGREEIEGGVRVEGFDSGPKRDALAHALFVGNITDNIKRRILDAPDDEMPRNIEPSPVHLSDIKLEIVQP